jgi:hypothetical protein
MKFSVPTLTWKSKYDLTGGGQILPFTFNSDGTNQIELKEFDGVLRLHLNDQANSLRVESPTFEFTYKTASGSFQDGLLGEFISILRYANLAPLSFHF